MNYTRGTRIFLSRFYQHYSISQYNNKLYGVQGFCTKKNISHMLKTYDHIKSKVKKQDNHHAIQIHENNLIKNSDLMNIRCKGCNVYLQSKDINKYGYIDPFVLNEAIQYNAKKINSVYEDKVKTKDSQILNIMHEVQNQLGVKLVNQDTGQFQNLDNLEVLMKVQDKIDQYQIRQQLKKKSKADRKDVLCFRCFSLKNHNRLPKQYDNNEGFTTDSKQFILNKIFNRHKNNEKLSVHFFIVVDVLDIFGTLPQDLVDRLLSQQLTFSIIVNKIDIINKKYLDQIAVHRQVNRSLKNLFQKYMQKSKDTQNKQDLRRQIHQIQENIRIFYLSSKSYEGYNKLKEYIDNIKGNAQLLGLPNTGKTTLINKLSKTKKSISKYPGTTIKITETQYGRGKNRVIYDMPGLYYPHLMYNMILKPSMKSILTWDKKITPGIFTHQVFIYGGRIQLKGARIIVTGLGGACSSNNRWFLTHISQFWKGLPPPHQLKIKKYERQIQFVNGVANDLQIAGYGFIGFRLCNQKSKSVEKKIVTFYLPQNVEFRFRESILSNDKLLFHNKSALTKQHMLQRLYVGPQTQKRKNDKKIKNQFKPDNYKQRKKKLLQSQQQLDTNYEIKLKDEQYEKDEEQEYLEIDLQDIKKQ